MPSPAMPAAAPRRRTAGRLAWMIAWSALGLVPLLGAVPGPVEAAGETTERWYTMERTGQKTGYLRVVWAPSTWEGRKTVHDTTTMVQRTARRMAGMRDNFEVNVTIDIERDADGRLWWQRYRREEAGRVMEEELTWTGEGYLHVTHLAGEEKRIEIPLDEPVSTDAESFLGPKVRAGEATPGATFTMRSLNVPARRADEIRLDVVGRERIPDGTEAEAETLKVRETHAESRSSTLLWLDAGGVLVQLRGEDGSVIRRTTRDEAVVMPTRPAEYSITVPASPRLERIFSADRVFVDVLLQGDEHRPVPELPTSPWSRVLSTEGSDAEGWRLKTELSSYDGTGKTTSLPIDPARFEKELEATVLMPVADERLKGVAAGVVGEESDAREAAYRLARFVYLTLVKRSPEVSQASALQILEDRCGDCSEHALLFVALCRAAGIPARQCSGYVCIGSLWGAHAWAEVWVGEWISADPTTGEIGGGARYLFFGYPDTPDSYPGVVSSRVSGRMRFVATRLTEGEAAYDLTDADTHRIEDEAGRRYLSVLSGLEARDVPEDWSVRLHQGYRMRVEGPEVKAELHALGDQGMDLAQREGMLGGASEGTFAGLPALVHRSWQGKVYEVFSRRRLIRVLVREGEGEALAQLERVLAPTFAAAPLPWTPAPDDTPDDD